jgi:hypothetical protein
MSLAARSPAPLFITGTARAGTNLLARLLSYHPSVEIAIDPYMPLLRSFRNAAISNRCDAVIAARYTAAPFQDYYFTDERLGVMDVIQAADLDLPFDNAEAPALREAIKARAGLESPDLEPLLGRLSGKTFRALFDSALALIAAARDASECAWVGTKEVWSVEFCAALARAYPRAKFIVIMRDPRAVVASMHKLAEKDATQRAHTLSYLRHWRKCAAFCTHYDSLPLLSGRFQVVRYEDLVSEPARTARVLCDFLSLEFVPGMEQTEGFWDPATRSMWYGNSSYTERVSGIETGLAERWRTSLDPAVLALVELACGPEMRLFGYGPLVAEPIGPDPHVLDFLARDDQAQLSWRSDLQDVQQDYGFELFRIAAAGLQALQNEKMIRRCFLFETALAAIRGNRASVTAEPATANDIGKHRLEAHK